MFLDNAPCHPPSLKGMFSNIQIEFLPKNTTCRTQPLDPGIIKTWKAHYRRKVLQYVASQIDGTTAASDIIKYVNLLIAIRWMIAAWEEVKPEVVTKCFKHVGMCPEEPDGAREEEDDPFAGKELLDLQELIAKVSQAPPGDLPCYAEVLDEDAPTHEPSVDSSDPNWRDNLCKEVIEQHRQELDNENDEYDQPSKAPAIRAQ